MQIKIDNLDYIDKAAQEFVENMGGKRIFAFYGKMGTGKTTFIRAVCTNLGVTQPVTSPTFAIVNEYSYDGDSKNIYHFDFYRVKTVEEAYDIGCVEYFCSGDICFIEWPEIVRPLLPSDTVKVDITEEDDGSRTITL